MNDLKQKTSSLIRKLKERVNNGEDPVDVLENAFEGRTALVISGGPSAIEWESVLEDRKSQQPVIICIKDAIKLVGDLCDLHFLNSSNLVKYNSHFEALTVMTHNGFTVPTFSSFDVEFYVLDKLIGDSKYSLAAKKNFECYTLNNTGVYRPVGPGIMHETVIFSLVHLGFKKITTIGWDIADENGANIHFNDKGTLFNQVAASSGERANLRNQIKLLLKDMTCLKKLSRTVVSAMPYYFGSKINVSLMHEGEAEIVSSSIASLKDWLTTKGITLEIISNSKWTK